MFRIGLLAIAALALAGCGETIRPATVYQGECRLFDDPGFRVRGLTTADKRWIATTQEKGIQVCGWKRPPSMPEPASMAQAFDCATVHQVVGLFGGDAAKAEAYAISQGATPEHIVAARQCLVQPVAVKATKKFRGKKRVFFSQRTLEPAPAAVVAPAPAPKPATIAIPSPISPAQAAPVAAAGQPKPSRWQRTKAKFRAGWQRVKKPFQRKKPD